METGKNSRKHVVVISADCCLWTVSPNEVLCTESDQIYFQNLTKDKAIVTFADNQLVGAARIEIAAGDTHPVQVAGVPFGSYPYVVFSAQNTGFMNKISKPRIIIYRPIT
jgi:hypothetical protein